MGWKKVKRLFSKKKKDKQPPPNVEETALKLNSRAEHITEKINQLNVELLKCRDLLRSNKGRLMQSTVKSRAKFLLQQKKMLEAQRDVFYNHAFSLDQMTFATENIKDAQHTVGTIQVSSKEITGTLKKLKIDKIDRMQDDIQDLASYGSEMHESVGQNYSVPEQLDEEDVLGELDALEDDMVMPQDDQVPAYLQSNKRVDAGVERDLPSSSTRQEAQKSQYDNQDTEEFASHSAPRVHTIKV